MMIFYPTKEEVTVSISINHSLEKNIYNLYLKNFETIVDNNNDYKKNISEYFFYFFYQTHYNEKKLIKLVRLLNDDKKCFLKKDLFLFLFFMQKININYSPRASDAFYYFCGCQLLLKIYRQYLPFKDYYPEYQELFECFHSEFSLKLKKYI